MSNASGSTNIPILGAIPNWVGFGIIIVIGILAIVFGAISRSPGLIAFGVAAIAASVIGYVVGGRSRPSAGPGDDLSFGATVERIDGWAWIIIFLLFVAAVLIAVFVH